VLERIATERYPATMTMPRPQALLAALRQVLPDVADTVLQRTRHLYVDAAGG